VKIQFIEIQVDWPCELSIFELREYVLSKLDKHGEPLRWAITSLTNYSEEKIQKVNIEAVLIIDDD
tara:strand:+ start:249 stop:446 length:198 start_codon:yes stop_codon:yes gene_type:complete